MVCAIDCGLAVNPDGVHVQMEGCIVYGLTAALYGEITLEQGLVKKSNFHDYRMLRMNEMPLIEVYIVPGFEKMGGTGEPGVPPLAPALANALFAATGNDIENYQCDNTVRQVQNKTAANNFRRLKIETTLMRPVIFTSNQQRQTKKIRKDILFIMQIK